MLGGEKNLKDENTALGIVLKDNNTPISYTKTNKLITALYMVTDIMDTSEPLRNKLRTLGTGIVSDTYSSPIKATPKIAEVMSFLDIAEAVNLISEMNANILRKEFLELKQSIEDSIQVPESTYREINLSDLFKSDFTLPSDRIQPTRIGVQKGSTLLQAIKSMSNKGPAQHEAKGFRSGSIKKTKKPNADYDVLKGQRREEIISIIKTSPNGATITDIKDNAKGHLVSCSDKTLQRELVKMVKSGVLKKEGEKRWSKYFIA